jgi:hypothetical protein
LILRAETQSLAGAIQQGFLLAAIVIERAA